MENLGKILYRAFLAISLLLWSCPPPAVSAATAGTITYSYDSLGRITQETYPANSAAFAYDNAGNRTAMTQN